MNFITLCEKYNNDIHCNLTLQVQGSCMVTLIVKPRVVLAICRNNIKSTPLTDDMKGDTRD